MCAAIETLGKCEIRAAIRFLQAEGHSAAEIHCRMSAVSGPNFMGDKCVREWCRKFRDGRTDVHEEGQGRPSLVADDHVQHIDKVVCERRPFTISELSLEFPQVCRTVLYEIVTKKTWLPQVLCQMGARNAR
jgi:transposase